MDPFVSTSCVRSLESFGFLESDAGPTDSGVWSNALEMEKIYGAEGSNQEKYDSRITHLFSFTVAGYCCAFPKQIASFFAILIQAIGVEVNKLQKNFQKIAPSLCNCETSRWAFG